MRQIAKTSTSTDKITIDFSADDAIVGGATVSSCALNAFDLLDNSSASSIISGSAAVTSTTATATIVNGTLGKDYLVIFAATLSNGEVIHKGAIVKVRTAELG